MSKRTDSEVRGRRGRERHEEEKKRKEREEEEKRRRRRDEENEEETGTNELASGRSSIREAKSNRVALPSDQA